MNNKTRNKTQIQRKRRKTASYVLGAHVEDSPDLEF